MPREGVDPSTNRPPELVSINSLEMTAYFKEVDRHREIINGILPAYVRLRYAVDRLEEEVITLRRKARQLEEKTSDQEVTIADQKRKMERQNEAIMVLQDLYFDLGNVVASTGEEEAEKEEEEDEDMYMLGNPNEAGPSGYNGGSTRNVPMEIDLDEFDDAENTGPKTIEDAENLGPIQDLGPIKIRGRSMIRG